jgi:hypothetical protein
VQALEGGAGITKRRRHWKAVQPIKGGSCVEGGAGRPAQAGGVGGTEGGRGERCEGQDCPEGAAKVLLPGAQRSVAARACSTGAHAPGVPVNTSATVKGWERKRWILRARATVILSSSLSSSMPRMAMMSCDGGGGAPGQTESGATGLEVG